uniref:Uncharacterized protein n=1 Tax=Siphoviridae sp. ct4Z13 TaxID=2827778 RepID=A0A8S5SCD9_9CAUD|nr:MAG TPA: hypothetical protein [Siphoviridae sp. ct4Z13]
MGSFWVQNGSTFNKKLSLVIKMFLFMAFDTISRDSKHCFYSLFCTTPK